MFIQYRSRACTTASSTAMAMAAMITAASDSAMNVWTQRGPGVIESSCGALRKPSADAGEMDSTCGREGVGMAGDYRHNFGDREAECGKQENRLGAVYEPRTSRRFGRVPAHCGSAPMVDDC